MVKIKASGGVLAIISASCWHKQDIEPPQSFHAHLNILAVWEKDMYLIAHGVF